MPKLHLGQKLRNYVELSNRQNVQRELRSRRKDLGGNDKTLYEKMSAALDRNQVQLLSHITTGTTWKSESFGSPSVGGNSEPYRFGIRSPAEIKYAPTSSTYDSFQLTTSRQSGHVFLVFIHLPTQAA